MCYSKKGVVLKMFDIASVTVKTYKGFVFLTEPTKLLFFMISISLSLNTVLG